MPNGGPHDVIAQLLLASDSTPEQIDELVGRLTLPEVARALVEEIDARCEPPPEVAVEVLFEIHHGTGTVAHTIGVAGGKTTISEGRSGDPGALISYHATDLVLALYGPGWRRGGRTRRVDSLLRLPGKGSWEDTYQLFLTQQDYALAVQAVVAACSPGTPLDLGQLSVRFRSDKWGFINWFTEHYERHFGHLVDAPIRLLEIGVGGYADPTAGGGSLRMWQRYFRRGQIYGLDIHDKSAIQGPRLHTVRADQNDPDALRAVVAEHGPFDVVVDDGSHQNEHMRTSFEVLFPLLRDGGIYAIEDLFTTYWPGYGGAAPHEAGDTTMMARIKDVLDDLHHPEHRDPAAGAPTAVQTGVSGVYCYRSVVFVEKGLNTEGALPSWVPRNPV